MSAEVRPRTDRRFLLLVIGLTTAVAVLVPVGKQVYSEIYPPVTTIASSLVTPEPPGTECGDVAVGGWLYWSTMILLPESDAYSYEIVDNLAESGGSVYQYDYTVTATPADGFSFPDDAVSTWFFSGETDCVDVAGPTTTIASSATTTVPSAPSTCFRSPCGGSGGGSGGPSGGGSPVTSPTPRPPEIVPNVAAPESAFPRPGPGVINPQDGSDVNAAIDQATQKAEVVWWFADEQLVQNVETTMTIQLNPLNYEGLAVDPGTGETSEPDPEHRVDYGRKNRLQVRSRCLPEGSDNCDFDVSPSDWQTNDESDLDWTVHVTPRKSGTLLLVIDVQPVVRVIGVDDLMTPINQQVGVDVDVNPAQDALTRIETAAGDLIVSVPDENDLVVGRPFGVNARFDRPDATEIVTVALDLRTPEQAVSPSGGPSGTPSQVSSWSWTVIPTEVGALKLDFEFVARAEIGDRQGEITRTTSKQLVVGVRHKSWPLRLWDGLVAFVTQLEGFIVSLGAISAAIGAIWKKRKGQGISFAKLAFWRKPSATGPLPPPGDEPVAVTPSGEQASDPTASSPDT